MPQRWNKDMKILNTDSDVLSGRASASTHFENRHVAVRTYLEPSEIGRGPNRSTPIISHGSRA